MLESLSWVDIGLMAFLVLSVVFGLARGLVFEVCSTLGWVAAYFAAVYGGPLAIAYVHVGPPGSALNRVLAFAGVFFLALLVCSFAARLIRMLVRATPLGAIDRMLGAGFGLARGVLLLLVMAAVVGLTPWRFAPAWQQSEGALWLQAALENLKPLLPPGWSQRLPAAPPGGTRV